MTSGYPLYERDPDAYRAYLAEGNRTQARKRVGADVVFRDRRGRVLLVDPRYKPDWDLPGGMAELNESPMDAARREIAEELGLDYGGGRLLVVDWVPPHGPWDDSLMFVFDGAILTDDQQARISLRDGELDGHQFCDPERARALLRPYVWHRLARALTALRTGTCAYLHGGTSASIGTEPAHG
jgi:8-oxo-dGTP diphosphatase